MRVELTGDTDSIIPILWKPTRLCCSCFEMISGRAVIKLHATHARPLQHSGIALL